MIVSGDYYEVLGVPRDADAKTIKEAFRQLARRYHPDISTEPDAEQRFKEIAEAYAVLSDPARRASYDAQGSAGLAGATAEDLWGGIDFTDIFGSGAAAFGNLFERLFGPAAAGPQRGEDVRLDLAISLEEVLTGGNQAVTIRRPGPCPRCAGSGSEPGTSPRRCPGCGGTGQLAVASWHGPLLVRQVTRCPECGSRGRVIDQPCPACAASGTAVREETVIIRVPPGIPEGATLRLAGHGMPGPMPGGPPGDAYVSIRTAPTPGSPGSAPICGTICTSRHPTPPSASPRPCPVPCACMSLAGAYRLARRRPTNSPAVNCQPIRTASLVLKAVAHHTDQRWVLLASAANNPQTIRIVGRLPAPSWWLGGPPRSSCRRRPQTTPSCCGQEPWW